MNVKIGILLHLYQPPYQSEQIVREVYTKCYSPLIKFIKNSRNFKVTLNIPLSLLELLDRYGYADWMSQLKELVEAEKVELTGSAAYHPLLTKIPQSIAEKQIFLNEYGLGFYFGRHSGFEGEPSVLIKDLDGFFPPELAVNENIVKLVGSLGYKWILVDQPAVPNLENGVGVLSDQDICVVPRDRNLSNILSFKRDLEVEDIWLYLQNSSKEFYIAALDGETFGHHYKDGLILLESLCDKVETEGAEFDLISNMVSDMHVQDITNLMENSWGSSDEEIKEGVIYPMWNAPDNPIHAAQWKLIGELSNYEPVQSVMSDDSFETIPLWNIPDASDPVLKEVLINITFLKCFNSDQFWWASKKQLPTGNYLYHPGMVKDSMKFVESYAELTNNPELKQYIQDVLKVLL